MDRLSDISVMVVRRFGRSVCGVALAGMTLAISSTAAHGGVVPDYDFQWATITHAGNRAANATEAPFLLGAPSPGRVDYEYRIATKEVTVGQWYEFVQAYAPFYHGDRSDPSLTGLDIYPTSLDPQQPAGFRIVTGRENRPATMSWQFAARYANWLHNDKAMTAAAFETGAYDAAGLPGTPNVFPRRLPGARFWIPSVDEWTKAVYFDPDRYGTDQPGYWMYALGSDRPGIPGPPGVGQTAAGYSLAGSTSLDVGSYPESLTPWGLLDASGGVQEWTDSSQTTDPERWFLRYYRGSEAGSSLSDVDLQERIDEYWANAGQFASTNWPGLRLASTIPATPAAIPVMLAITSMRRRRR